MRANADRLQLKARLEHVLPAAEAARITWALKSDKLVQRLVHDQKHRRQGTAELLTFIYGKLNPGPAAAAAVRGVQSRGEVPQPTTSSREVPAPATSSRPAQPIGSPESHWHPVSKTLAARAAATSLERVVELRVCPFGGVKLLLRRRFETCAPEQLKTVLRDRFDCFKMVRSLLGRFGLDVRGVFVTIPASSRDNRGEHAPRRELCSAPEIERELQLAALVQRDCSRLGAQHLGCVVAVAMGGGVCELSFVVRHSTLESVELIYKYIEAATSQSKLDSAARDLATVVRGALLGLQLLHDHDVTYGCAQGAGGLKVAFRKLDSGGLLGKLVDFGRSSAPCFSTAAKDLERSFQADRRAAAIQLGVARQRVQSKCKLVHEMFVTAVVRLRESGDLRQAAAVLCDVQSSQDRLDKQSAEDARRRRAREEADAKASEQMSAQRRAAAAATAAAATSEDLRQRVQKRPHVALSSAEVGKRQQSRLSREAMAAAHDKKCQRNSSDYRWRMLTPMAQDLATVSQHSEAEPLLLMAMGSRVAVKVVAWCNQHGIVEPAGSSLTVQQLTSATHEQHGQLMQVVPSIWTEQDACSRVKLRKFIKLLAQHLDDESRRTVVAKARKELVFSALNMLFDWGVEEEVPKRALQKQLQSASPRFTDAELKAVLAVLEEENHIMYRDSVIHRISI